jgi:hypothetical protein
MTRTRTALLAGLLLPLAWAPVVAAQSAGSAADTVRTATPVAAGSVVRLTRDAPPERYEGTLLRADSVIAVWRQDGRAEWRVPASSVARLEVWAAAPSAPAHRHRGAKIGLLVGIVPSVAAVVLGTIVDGNSGGCDESICVSATGAAVVGGVLFTALTTGVGALIDHGRSAGARGRAGGWAPVRLPVRLVSPDTAVAPHP